jgi:phosphoserine phosphatase RsbU/P
VLKIDTDFEDFSQMTCPDSDTSIRAALTKMAGDLQQVVESHQPIEVLDGKQWDGPAWLVRCDSEGSFKWKRIQAGDSSTLHRDLEIARDVQRASFPQEIPTIPGLTCASFYQPAHSVGGDYYDFLPLPSGAWGIAIGDVCGKGIGAALLMAGLQASLRVQAMHAHSGLSNLIADVDRLILAASPKHLYASLFYSEFDTATRVLRYVNAGHNAPIVLRWKNGRCEAFHLELGGAALGLLESSQFTSSTFQFEKGDVFVAYTDGITESANHRGELWGQERLETLLRACRDCAPAQIVERILDEIRAFGKDCSPKDDMTLVVAAVRDEV